MKSFANIIQLHQLLSNARVPVSLEFPCSRPDELVMDIVRHGSGVEVLAPAELRKEVAERHRAAAALYI